MTHELIRATAPMGPVKPWELVADRKVADIDEVGRAEWLTLRRNGIGSSDAPAVLGWSPWRGPWATWLDKTGALPLDSVEQTEAMEIGSRIEEFILDLFGERTGIHPDQPLAVYRHPDHDWMLASPDGLALRDGELGIIEAKNVSAYKADEWAAGDKDEDGVWRGGEAPAHYIAQVQHQHAVLGTSWGYLAALLGGNRLVVVEVPRDDEFIRMLTAVEEGFWRDHVLGGVAPPMDELDATTELLTDVYDPADPDATVELDEPTAQVIRDYHEASALAKQAEAERKRAGNVLRDALGHAEVATFRGVPVASWKASTRQDIDRDRLRSEFPEVAEKVSTTSPVRTLRPGRSKAAREALGMED